MTCGGCGLLYSVRGRGPVFKDCRLALSLDQPVIAHTSSRSVPLAPLVAAEYCFANFLVISWVARIDTPLSMKLMIPFRGQNM